MQLNGILVVILNGDHEAVSVLVVPLEYTSSALQLKGDTLGVAILSSNQKWRFLKVEGILSESRVPCRDIVGLIHFTLAMLSLHLHSPPPLVGFADKSAPS